MAAPSYATDLNDIFTDGSITGWTAIGGGASGLNQEVDYYIQGTSCLSKNAWASATKGMIYDNGSGITVPSNGAIMMWVTHLTPNSLAAKTSGGIQVLVGSSSTAYKHWYVGGSDTITFGGWIIAAVDPSTTNQNITGSPTATLQTFGGLASLPSGGPTKGSPFGIDAIRYGRVTLTCTNGDGTNGYATFSGATTYASDTTRRWGQLNTRDGAYYLLGFLSLGSTSTTVDFRDSNKVIFIRDTDRVTSAFNRIEVLNASSNVEWTNISIQALGATSPGTFVVTAGTFSANSCTFTDMGTFTFISSSTITSTTFRRCDQITQNSATISDGTVTNSTASTSILSNNPTNITNCNFTSDGSNHAIEITTPGTYNITGHTFTGYAASDGSTGNETIYNNSGGSVTLNASGNTGNLSIRNGAGASTTIASNPVTTTITVKDVSTGSVIQAANVLAWVTDNANYFYQASVSIAGSGTTATVTHANHGLTTGDYVIIEGATNDDDYNGVFQVTVSNTSTYTYTTSETLGTSPATGTVLATFALISDTTNASGIVADTRSLTFNQPIAGWVRKSSSAPYYQEGSISGTVNNSNGLSVTIQLSKDE